MDDVEIKVILRTGDKVNFFIKENEVDNFMTCLADGLSILSNSPEGAFLDGSEVIFAKEISNND